MKRAKYLYIVLVILAVIPIRVLVISEAGKGLVPAYISRVQSHEIVIVKYIHSVERTPWHHYYSITSDNKLKLVAMRFQSFGAGVPDFAPISRMVDGWIEYSGYDYDYPNLIWNVQVSLEHRFELRGQDIYFGDLVTDQTNAIIRVTNRPLLYFLVIQNQLGG